MEQVGKNNSAASSLSNKKNGSPLSLTSNPPTGARLHFSALIEEWKRKKLELCEFSLRTRFSTLDGINSPLAYIKNAHEKNYRALLVNEHNNVQSFPEFWEASLQSTKLRVLYGCEFEMLSGKPLSFLTYPGNEEEDLPLWDKPVNMIRYCIFDLETTGLFAAYDQIINLAYVIIQDERVIVEGDYLVRVDTALSKPVEKLTGISSNELEKAPPLEEVLRQVRNEWEKNGVELLVSHNLKDFDLPFLSKAWQEVFGEKIRYPGIDTLPLARVFIPGRKSYSLEKISSQGRNKVEQVHRALDDALLLKSLFERITKLLREQNLSTWRAAALLAPRQYYHRGAGTRIIVVARNNEGLASLYKLVKIAHVDNFFRVPFLLRADVEKYRHNLLIGASGGPDEELFSSFSGFTEEEEVSRKIKFYDYVEVRPPDSFSHFLKSERISQRNLEELLSSLVRKVQQLGVKVIAVNNVYYCTREERKIKEIIIANDGMNGTRHPLYSFAVSELFGDCFELLPNQHLRTIEEVARNWEFLQDAEVIENIVFHNQTQLLKLISRVEIRDEYIGYPSSSKNEQEIMSFCLRRANQIFSNKIPPFARERIHYEWKIIKENYLAIYWICWKIVAKAQEEGNIVGSRGSVGCSLIAYLLGITDINPLPLYSICDYCKNVETAERSQQNNELSCYDFPTNLSCLKCREGRLKFEGHSLPFETFVGWNGEKTPDIDLNFSGEYQRTAHNYVRQLLGTENVYRIGTINKLSQQTAESFWDEHQKLRKTLDPNFNIYSWISSLAGQNSDPGGFFATKERAINLLKGIKRTTGQHPGGLLVVPPSVNILDFTALNYPADDPSSDWLTTHFEYSFLSKIFLKLDLLGHDEPTILQRLSSLTGKNPLNEEDVSFKDQRVMNIFTNCETLGIPEFGTDLVKKSLLEPVRPTKFSQLVQISGFSHGTDVWMQNQQRIHREGKLPLSELLACREDILALLDRKGIDKENAFQATEFIRKGKWEKLAGGTKDLIRSKLGSREGELYFSILEKIKYIFPKPHAIAYTMTAWRTAYYKVYYPEAFYSVLLTYHAAVYDLWLMTLDTEKSIPFRLEKLLASLDTLKVSRKDFISISKVLIKLAKENEKIRGLTEVIFSTGRDYYQLFGLGENFSAEQLNHSFNLLAESLQKRALSGAQNSRLSSRPREKISKELEYLENARSVLLNVDKRKSYDRKLAIQKRIRENFSSRDFSDWKLTMKEKNLLFTLKVIAEIQQKGFNYTVGIDFNNSETHNFKFAGGKMLIPFLAVTSIGEALANKLVAYRKSHHQINYWKSDLKKILNKKHFEQFLDLEENNLLFS